MRESDKSKRALNYLIDWVLIYLIYFVVTVIFLFFYDVLANKLWSYTILIYYILYYLLFEYYYQKTPGKMVTKTIVVNLKGLKPSFGYLLIRTIVRLNPFDLISYVFGVGKGQHDYFSKTIVVDDNESKISNV